ncbi:hypothetical protein AB0F77_14310 [Streptomyces sp. NPDC026672]|uniref:hypothetical protein n=1 Tax=unclassified Streptomyces TaxID=2593676 RepID=UPI0033C8499A
MTNSPPERTLIYAVDLTPENVRALETFLNAQLGRVSEDVGETGETSPHGGAARAVAARCDRA